MGRVVALFSPAAQLCLASFTWRVVSRDGKFGLCVDPCYYSARRDNQMYINDEIN